MCISEINNDTNSERRIVIIKETSGDTSNKKHDFKKYNWVDVKSFAKKIFWDYKFEIAWAEDMWNILMFNDVVNSKNIVSTEHNDFENGDILLWLMSMNKLFFEYKVVVGLEYEFDREPVDECTYTINNASFYLEKYLYNDVKKRIDEEILNNDIPKNYIYNENNQTIDDYYYELIFDDVLFDEVIKREKIVKNKIYSYFNNDCELITYFMQGYHYYDNYLNVNNYIENEKDKIVNKYKKILKLIRNGNIVKYINEGIDYLYEEEYEVEADMENELMELEQYYNSFISDVDSYEVYNWICCGMIY